MELVHPPSQIFYFDNNNYNKTLHPIPSTYNMLVYFLDSHRKQDASTVIVQSPSPISQNRTATILSTPVFSG